MVVVLPSLIVGPIAIVIGILVFVFRKPIRDSTVDSEGAALGKRAGERLGRLQTSAWVGVAGLGGVLVGVVMVVGGLATLLSSAG
ncbi:hypothetical protein GCM10027406_29660 [Leifsonia lichenia]